jgi:isoleucyl-tRNA synthetase
MSQNYRDTLNLPRTEFPMKANLAAREPEMLRAWEATRLYQQIQKSREGRELFVLHDGPPFANGDVHMGTALNKILKDFVVKSQTMLGKRAPYVPGWDCHGLPIEYKVVKESRALSPLEIRKKSEAFARKFIDIQREQFKRLGVFGDWENPYLTMDPKYEAEILRAFAVFVEERLVYQAKKPVFWSTGAQTALAEAEVEYQERDDTAVYVRFPLPPDQLAKIGLPTDKPVSVAIWTTTPWTLAANLAIAVDPGAEYELLADENERVIVVRKLRHQFIQQTGFAGVEESKFGLGKQLVELQAQHPFLNRKSIVLAADFVTMDTGTGAVHIAPGHGEDDYWLGKTNGLEILSPVDDHGRFTEEANLPDLTGKYVFDANRDIVALLRKRGMLLGEQTFHHSYPYCWRSKTPIIFRNVEQFFIRIDALRDRALEAIHNEVKWIPAWGENRIAGTVESRPDWVISRQRSWGVPLPVFYSKDGKAILDAKIIRKLADLVAQRGSNIWFELNDVDLASALGLPEGTTHRNDTIDVWIDSGVSHKAVLQTRPELHSGNILEPQDVQKAGVELPFRPADMYLEATDQHRGWFQSSLMTSVALNNRAPYKTCVTHGFVVDVDGKKISKSGTYDKPMAADHFVGQHGADLVRLWASSIDYTDDVPFSEEMFARLGDSYRRIRNTLRILLGNLYDFPVAGVADPAPRSTPAATTLIDRWILERLDDVIRDCRSAYQAFEFHKVYHTLNQFCAVDLSSLYIDITKDRMYCDAADSPRRRATQTVMHEMFGALCRLLAPILAFTAEEAWRHSPVGASVHLQEFPQAHDRNGRARQPGAPSAHVAELLRLRGVIGQAIERARQEKLIGNTLEAKVVLHSNSDVTEQVNQEELEEFFIVSDLTIHQAKQASASVTKTPYEKCARCWRHRPSVGASKAHPNLCDRCESVVEANRSRVTHEIVD